MGRSVESSVIHHIYVMTTLSYITMQMLNQQGICSEGLSDNNTRLICSGCCGGIRFHISCQSHRESQQGPGGPAGDLVHLGCTTYCQSKSYWPNQQKTTPRLHISIPNKMINMDSLIRKHSHFLVIQLWDLCVSTMTGNWWEPFILIKTGNYESSGPESLSSHLFPNLCMPNLGMKTMPFHFHKPEFNP